MIFPVIYAVLTWYAAVRWRRRWLSFVLVGLSITFLCLLGRLAHAWEGHFSPAFRTNFVLFWPYTLLVGVIGAYICILPRRYHDLQCRGCGYDLAGLELQELSCPECGDEWRGKGSGKEVKEELTPIPMGPPLHRRAL
jgi:hypothetical protein